MDSNLLRNATHTEFHSHVWRMILSSLRLTRSLLFIGGALFLVCGPAIAVPVLVFDAGEVIGVDLLEEGGMLFNARWEEGSFNTVGQNPPVFDGDQPGVTSIVNQMIGLFNLNTVTPVNIGGLCTNNSQDCDLVLTYNVNATTIDAVNVEWNQGAAQQWELMNQNWSRDFDNNLVAQVTLTKVSVPEPSTILLLALGLASGAIRRRRLSS